MIKSKVLVATSLVGLFSIANLSVALADETNTEKVENTAGDVKTSAKKTGRKINRKIRKATGNDNLMKDAKDKAHDMGDDISNSAEKAKKKAD